MRPQWVWQDCSHTSGSRDPQAVLADMLVSMTTIAVGALREEELLGHQDEVSG